MENGDSKGAGAIDPEEDARGDSKPRTDVWAAVALDITDHIRDGEPERSEEKPFRVVREAFLESIREEDKAGGDCSRDACE